MGKSKPNMKSNNPEGEFFVGSPTQTQPPENSTRNKPRREKGISIVSSFIEGVKTNIAYFQKLCKTFDIVCIQEHWLWEFQSHEISKLGAEKDFIIRCSDYLDPISGVNLPRGKGGVCRILWPKAWSSKVKRLNEGNERIVAIEITCNNQEKLCLINTYMPTNNSSVNSHMDYSECLDTIHQVREVAKFTCATKSNNC